MILEITPENRVESPLFLLKSRLQGRLICILLWTACRNCKVLYGLFLRLTACRSKKVTWSDSYSNVGHTGRKYPFDRTEVPDYKWFHGCHCWPNAFVARWNFQDLVITRHRITCGSMMGGLKNCLLVWRFSDQLIFTIHTRVKRIYT